MKTDLGDVVPSIKPILSIEFSFHILHWPVEHFGSIKNISDFFFLFLHKRSFIKLKGPW